MALTGRRSYVGVDLGHARIKAVVAEKTPTGFRVVKSGVAPTPPDAIRDGVVIDPDAVGDALRGLLKDAHIHASTAIVAASGGAVFVRQVPYPKMAPAMLRESLRFEAGRHIPGSVEDSYVEGEIVGMVDEAQMNVLLVAAPKDLVGSRTAACVRAGLAVEEVDIEAFATYRALAEADPHRDLSGKTIAFVDLGSSTTSVSIVRDGNFTMHRTLSGGGKGMTDALMSAFGLGVEDAEAGKAQLRVDGLLTKGAEIEPPVKVLQSHLDDLVRELKRSLNYYQSQNAEASEGAKVDAIFLTGGAARLQGVDRYLEAKLGLPTQAAGVYDNPSITHGGTHDDPGLDLAVATGLALRPFFRPVAAKPAKAAKPNRAEARKAA